MKFKCNVGSLLEGVNRVTSTVDTTAGKGAGKAGSMTSAKVYLWVCRDPQGNQFLYLYSTNVTAESVIKIDAEVEQVGETLLDPEQLRGGLAKRASEEVAFVELLDETGNTARAAKARRIRVKIGKSSFHMPYDPAGTESMKKKVEKIPFKVPASFKMPGADMSEFVRRGMFCIPHEDAGTTKFRMGGLNIVGKDDGYVAHATDGHVAARIKIKGDKRNALHSVIVPYKSLPALNQLIQRRKNEDIEIIEGIKSADGDPNKMFFKMGDSIFGTCLLNGKFPDVSTVIDAQRPDNWILVDRIGFRDALQRAAAFDRELGHVTMTLEGNVLSLRAKSEHGELDDALEVEKVSGPDKKVSVTVNLHYLISISSGSAGETLRMGINSIRGSAVVLEATTEENVDSKYAVMPIRD